MESHTVNLTSDEIEDIRFALARLADSNEGFCEANVLALADRTALIKQANRMRRLARNITRQR